MLATQCLSRWWQLNFFLGIFTPKIGEDGPILTVRICFTWVGKNHQLVVHRRMLLWVRSHPLPEPQRIYIYIYT